MSYHRPLADEDTNAVLMACSICGTQGLYPTEIRFCSDKLFRCNMFCDDPHIAFDQDKLNGISTRRREQIAPRFKVGRAAWPTQAYQDVDQGILDLICKVAPYDLYDPIEGKINTTASALFNATAIPSPRTAGYACVYLYSLYNEGTRPAGMLSRAKDKLVDLADFLLSAMAEGPSTTGTNDSPIWGAYKVNRGGQNPTVPRYDATDTAIAGIALLRAYQVTAVTKYLTGARACAWFIRGMQCGDKLTSYPSSSDSAGTTPIHHGAIAIQIANNAGSYQLAHSYDQLSNGLSLEFLYLYQQIVSNETIGSSTNTAPFNASRAATVSTAISELTAFWKNGALDSFTGTTRTGFTSNASNASDSYTSYPTDQGSFWGATFGTGRWDAADTVVLAMPSWAAMMRGMHVAGETTLAATVWAWLRTFTSRTVYHLSGALDETSWQTMAGTFDATLCLASLQNVALDNSFPVYAYDVAGWASNVYQANNPTQLQTLLGVLATERQIEYGSDLHKLSLARIGRSGLSYQPFRASDGVSGSTAATTNGPRYESVKLAAQVGLLFRYR